MRGQLHIIASAGERELAGDGGLRRDVRAGVWVGGQEMPRDRQGPGDVAHPFAVLRVQEDGSNVGGSELGTETDGTSSAKRPSDKLPRAGRKDFRKEAANRRAHGAGPRLLRGRPHDVRGLRHTNVLFGGPHAPVASLNAATCPWP
jgi:hypothetical protein